MMLTWRNVFDRKTLGVTKEENAAVAKDAGYQFMTWNGRIFFVEGKCASDTGLLAEDLDRRSLEWEPPKLRTSYALQIPMGHEIRAEYVMFKADRYKEGNALKQFETALETIVEREVEKRLATQATAAEPASAAQP
jgi:endo-beta-N-acetylglucosaminidase D